MKTAATFVSTLLFSLSLAGWAAAAENAGEGVAPNKPPPGAKIMSTTTGLQFIDVVEGKGAAPAPGDICIVHYTAWLEDGTQIDTSNKPRPVDPRDPSKGTKTLPFGFKLGSGQVIAGWDQGVSTMREGGTRLMFIPPSLAYGSKGAGKVIPPDARLTFRVELLKVKHDTAPAAAPAAPAPAAAAPTPAPTPAP